MSISTRKNYQISTSFYVWILRFLCPWCWQTARSMVRSLSPQYPSTLLTDSLHILYGFYTDYKVKTICFCIILALILYVLYHFHISSYPLSQSHYDTLNSYNILLKETTTHTLTSLIFATFPQLTFLFLLHPFKILYKFPNKPYKGM